MSSTSYSIPSSATTQSSALQTMSSSALQTNGSESTTVDTIAHEMAHLQLIPSISNFNDNIKIWRTIREQCDEIRKKASSYHVLIWMNGHKDGIQHEKRTDIRLWIHIWAKFTSSWVDALQIPMEWFLTGFLQEDGYRFLMRLAKLLPPEELPPIVRAALQTEQTFLESAQKVKKSKRQQLEALKATDLEVVLALIHYASLFVCSSPNWRIFDYIRDESVPHVHNLTTMFDRIRNSYNETIGTEMAAKLLQDTVPETIMKQLDTVSDIMAQQLVPHDTDFNDDLLRHFNLDDTERDLERECAFDSDSDTDEDMDQDTESGDMDDDEDRGDSKDAKRHSGSTSRKKTENT